MLARDARRWRKKHGIRRFAGMNSDRRHLRISFALWVSQEMEKVESEEKGTKRRRCRITPYLFGHAKAYAISQDASPSLPFCGRNRLVESNAIEAEASGNTTLRVNGTGSRAVPWGPGSKVRTGFRRCALVFESAHLGKSRRFLRRCAPFSKVRTENCASSQKPCAEVVRSVVTSPESRTMRNHWEFAATVHTLRHFLP